MNRENNENNENALPNPKITKMRRIEMGLDLEIEFVAKIN